MAFPLEGDYQMENLATAVSALEAFSAASGIAISDEAFKDGISSVSWPCRFQVLSNDPLVIVDGAHNPPASAALAESLRHFARRKPLALVAGYCSDKDAEASLRHLRPRFSVAFATDTPSERTLPYADLADTMRKVGFVDVRAEADWRKALEEARAWAGENGGGVVVAGSLFLAGAVAHEAGSGAAGSGIRIPSERLT
jgi:dihydrofolate synthase/folylpolyglutamate synthase